LSQSHAIIIGGTSGLGLSIAQVGLRDDVNPITPIILGRSVEQAAVEFEDGEAIFCGYDLTHSDPTEIDNILASDREIDYVFWVAGNPQPHAMIDMDSLGIDNMIDVHLLGPMKLIRHIYEFFYLRQLRLPQLVVISSTSAYKVRRGEDLYCALQAAKVAFATNFCQTMRFVDATFSVTLVMPAGMDSPFWQWSQKDTSSFLNTRDVADIIWRQVNGEEQKARYEAGFASLVIERNLRGEPIVSSELPRLQRPH